MRLALLRCRFRRRGRCAHAFFSLNGRRCRRPFFLCGSACFGLRRCCEDRLTSVCVLSAIHGRQLLSFACPKESNQRKRHPRGRGLPGIHAGKLREQAPGSAHGTSLCRDRTRAHPARARVRGTRLFPAPARRGREGTRKSRARQSLPQKHRIYPTRRFLFLLRFALRVPSEQRRRADGPAARSAGGARDRADFDNRPWMACGRNPSARSEPLAPRAARIRGCRFLWLLSFGQAKESNWRPWMADKPHTDVSRSSRQPQTRNQHHPHPTQPSP